MVSDAKKEHGESEDFKYSNHLKIDRYIYTHIISTSFIDVDY